MNTCDDEREHYRVIDEFWKEWDDYKIYEDNTEHPEPKDARMHWVYERMRQYPIKTVLDAGCGNGWHVRYLAERGYDVMGIDISRYAIMKARRMNPTATFRRANLETMRTIKRYDAVICLNVLNNSYWYKKVLRNLFRWSRGYVFVSVDMKSDAASKCHSFTHQTMLQLLGSYGTVISSFESDHQNMYEIYHDYVA